MAAHRSQPRPVRLTERDRELLAFVAEHRLVLGDHLASALGISGSAASGRLRALAKAGYLSSERIFDRQPACHQITRSGLAAIGSELPPPGFDLSCYRHDVGAGWLWLAASAGKLGPVRELVSERRMRSSDARPDRTEDPFGVRLGGVGRGGAERLHYPDLLLIAPGGQRLAVELERSPKGRARREKILAGYAADARIGAVLYLVEERAIGRAIQASARRLGISDLVHVQQVRIPGPRARAGRSLGANRTPPSRRTRRADPVASAEAGR